MARDLYKYTTERMSALKKERSHYLDEWRDMSDYILGARGRWLLEKRQQVTERRNPLVYNEQAKFASNTLASGMQTGITSPTRPWFNLTTREPDLAEYGPVKNWLSDVERILLEIFAKSNFYNSAHSMYRELGAFGNGVLGIYENFDTVIRCEPYTIGSYCLDTNGYRQVDTFYRQYCINVRQAVNRFGLENVSISTRRAYEKANYEGKVDILHAIEPNTDRDFDSPLAADMPFRSVYFETSAHGHRTPLKISGFREDPIMSPRWEVVDEDVYSSSYPGIDSINTNKSLQVEELDFAVGREKQHNPPMVGDASIDQEGLDLLAGGVTFIPNMTTTGRVGLRSVYDVNIDLNALSQSISVKEQRINRAFYADLFMMITEMDRRQITATEIAARQQEKLLMIGPVLERLNNEFLDPTIDRTYAIAQRAGIIPPAPPELEGQELQVEYISTLAQAQKAVATQSIETTAAFALSLAQANPNVLDKLDMDQMVDEYARAKGTPAKAIRSDDDVESMRTERAAQQNRQMMMEQAGNLSQSAKTLSETDTSGDNLLTQLAGAAGQGLPG